MQAMPPLPPAGLLAVETCRLLDIAIMAPTSAVSMSPWANVTLATVAAGAPINSICMAFFPHYQR